MFQSMMIGLLWFVCCSYLQGGVAASSVDCICHFSCADTVSSPRYMEWMRSFQPDTVHLMCGIGCCTPISPYRASSIHTHKLYAIAPQLFVPVPLRQPISDDVLQDDLLTLIPAVCSKRLSRDNFCDDRVVNRLRC